MFHFSKAIVNHYRILCLDSGYIIDIGGGVSKLLNNYYLLAIILSLYDSVDDEFQNVSGSKSRRMTAFID